jgi:predicted nucleic acid-binding protein
LNLVVDASVVLKWFFRSRPDEDDVANALALLEGIDTGRFRMLQPPHFLAEVSAVLAREKPSAAQQDLSDLWDINWESVEDPAVYATAIELSVRHRQHLFDTLYHGTALFLPDALLVTADQRYYLKARDEGRIVLLGDFPVGA